MSLKDVVIRVFVYILGGLTLILSAMSVNPAGDAESDETKILISGEESE